MKKITTEEFDACFDKGEDVTEFLEMSTARRPNQALSTEQADTGKTRELQQRYEECPEPGRTQFYKTARIVAKARVKSGLSDDESMTLAVRETRSHRRER